MVNLANCNSPQLLLRTGRLYLCNSTCNILEYTIIHRYTLIYSGLVEPQSLIVRPTIVHRAICGAYTIAMSTPAYCNKSLHTKLLLTKNVTIPVRRLQAKASINTL